jgi:hypothetical protein
LKDKKLKKECVHACPAESSAPAPPPADPASPPAPPAGQ